MTYPIVRKYNAVKTARSMARLDFSLTDDEIDLDGFTETDVFANHVLPRMRKDAGFDDSGAGTHTIEREVFVIEQHDAEEGYIVTSAVVLDQLVDEYMETARNIID